MYKSSCQEKKNLSKALEFSTDMVSISRPQRKKTWTIFRSVKLAHKLISLFFSNTQFHWQRLQPLRSRAHMHLHQNWADPHMICSDQTEVHLSLGTALIVARWRAPTGALCPAYLLTEATLDTPYQDQNSQLLCQSSGHCSVPSPLSSL